MLYCLVQTTNGHPRLAQALPPDGFLSPAEQAIFETLRFPKRRHDWLLGRWTAKQLIMAYLQQNGYELPPAAISITNAADGAPQVTGVPLPLMLSISHSQERAACVISAERLAFGVDIEQLAERAAGFIADYFTPDEQQAVAAAQPDQGHTATTIWSAKEAVLKTQRAGLTVSTTSVECLPSQRLASGWGRVQVNPAGYQCVYTLQDGFVLTIAYQTGMTEPVAAGEALPHQSPVVLGTVFSLPLSATGWAR